jgi:serine/threonine protein kinase
MSTATSPEEVLFYEALQLGDPAERKAFLKKACAGDLALSNAVEQLLADHEKAETVFRQSSAALGATNELDGAYTDANVGTFIGPYRLVQWLGEGGGGVVYMAEQEAPMRRQVALKVIKLGMDTKRVIARFEAERQTLALMEHPNIARVLDAGATETGRPYFVMELVRGAKITDYCARDNVPLRERLAMFQQVCHAIQHAHQKGIIHRDIKPSNILVTLQDGVWAPKIIDFGIAKATAITLADRTAFTVNEQLIGTPAYMSPEQIQGARDVDTRSDLYSLGVVLYELLAGRPPFDTEELLRQGIDEMRRVLCHTEPPRPSTTALHPREGQQPPFGATTLRGDLDWIVMKALEKERERRYHTARGFALDIEHYLQDEPVQARPPSRLYRLRKLVRRNKATFAALGATALALVVGLGTSTVLFFREREARREAEHARQETEHARRAESALRAASEARANIARAAYLLSHGRTEEADALVGKIPISINEPSLEAANVYRTLAEWNLRQNRWKKGVRQLLDLIHANQVDKTDMTYEATRDLLMAGPALVFAGNLEDYHRLVREMIARFGGTQSPHAAEQVLKFSLIVPTDAATLRALEPVANVAWKSVGTERATPENNSLLAWRALAVALFEYRAGHFDDAVAMARRCLGFSETRPTAIAMAHLVMGMALRQLNQEAEAKSEIRVGEAMVRSKIPIDAPIPSQIWGNDLTGYWYDWVFAHILLREAETLIEGAPAGPKE